MRKSRGDQETRGTDKGIEEKGFFEKEKLGELKSC